MAYGKVEYSADGLPKCEICGRYFKRVLSHVRQTHYINERDYKIQFGLDLIKGICSKESSEISRQRVFENYDKVVKRNLLKNGKLTRFKLGSKGRTVDQVSPQTKTALIENLKRPKMKKAMIKSGKRLGKSGIGNKVRWNKNK